MHGRTYIHILKLFKLLASHSFICILGITTTDSDPKPAHFKATIQDIKLNPKF